MKSSLALLVFLSCSLFAQQPQTAASIQSQVSAVQLDLAVAYLKANTNAPDALVAVNMVLESMQQLKKFDKMEPYLVKRYDLYAKAKGTPAAANPRSVITSTAGPIYSVMMQQKRIGDAAAFKERVIADWKGIYDNEVAQAFLQVDKQFAMPKVGMKLGNIAFSDFLTGQPIALQNYVGEVILLEFWVSKCDICKSQRFFTRQALADYGARGFKAFGFTQDEDVAKLKAYVESEKITWPQCQDLDPKHRFAQKLNLVGVPTNFLLDQTGTIVGVNLRDEKLLEEIDKLFK